MSKSINNTDSFLGGYFINNKPIISDFVSSGNFIVTYKEDKGLLISIKELIRTSQNYIKVCSFIIDNKEVFDALKFCLKTKRIAVFILTAINEMNLKSDLLSEEDSDKDSQNRHFEFISELVKLGAHVRASSNAHAKFALKDGNEAIIMSANLTEPSLNNNQKAKHPNPESGVRFYESEDINALEKVFDSIFLYGTEFKQFITLNNKNQLIDKKDINISSDDFPKKESNVLWTFESNFNNLYEKIVSLIDSGKKLILISTYSIVGIEYLPELLETMTKFIAKGGKIKLFCRAMNYRSDHLYGCHKLSSIGCEIYGDIFNHSKGILVDDLSGTLFTANIDGRHGLKNGFEVGYSMDNSHEAFNSFKDFIYHQISSAPFVFKVNPKKSELFGFYESWYSNKEQKPTYFPADFEIVYRSNLQFVLPFLEDIEKYPIFYSVFKRNDLKFVQFEINDKNYELEEINPNTFQLRSIKNKYDAHKGEKYILKYNNINLRSYDI